MVYISPLRGLFLVEPLTVKCILFLLKLVVVKWPTEGNFYTSFAKLVVLECLTR